MRSEELFAPVTDIAASLTSFPHPWFHLRRLGDRPLPEPGDSEALSPIPPPLPLLWSLGPPMGVGRTIPTYRLHLESILNDWMDYRRALREKDRETFDRVISKARQHASAASYCAHMDPTILALLSVLLEMEREIETLKRERSSVEPLSVPRADP